MRSLMIKTILVVSAVALTGALAWSDEINGINLNDVNLGQGINKPAGKTEGDTCPECEKRAAQNLLNAQTRAARQEGVPRSEAPDNVDGHK